jgi:hypothetical protein
MTSEHTTEYNAFDVLELIAVLDRRRAGELISGALALVKEQGGKSIYELALVRLAEKMQRLSREGTFHCVQGEREPNRREWNEGHNSIPMVELRRESIFARDWPRSFAKLEDDLWLPVGRNCKPIGCVVRSKRIKDHAHLAWRFPLDPRDIEGAWCAAYGDTLLLYDREPRTLDDFKAYAARLGRVLDAIACGRS